MGNLVKRLRDWEHVYPDDQDKPEGHLYKVAADRIEELEELLKAAQDDAKEAEAYAEELEADRRKTYEALLKVTRIHDEVEAKLAKAELIVRILASDKWNERLGEVVDLSCEYLAELKGGKDE